VLDVESIAQVNHRGVSFPGSTLSPFTGSRDEVQRKDVDALFPDWQRRVEPR